MTTHDIIKHTLGSAVSAGGTFTVAYPAGRTADDYLGGVDHMLISTSCQTLFAAAGDFTVTPGASNISITLVAGVALALGAVVNVHLDRAERANAATLANPDRMSELTVARISLGQPAAASANAIVLSQAATVLASLATGINGALATGGVATSGTAARGAHLYDPRTGQWVGRAGSTTVVGPTLVEADIWATALFVGDADTARRFAQAAASCSAFSL